MENIKSQERALHRDNVKTLPAGEQAMSLIIDPYIRVFAPAFLVQQGDLYEEEQPLLRPVDLSQWDGPIHAPAASEGMKGFDIPEVYSTPSVRTDLQRVVRITAVTGRGSFFARA